MTRLILAILFYAIACPVILNIHRWSPTNMAGPGLDIVIYFLTAVITVVFLARGLIKIRSGNRLSYLNLILSVVGTFLIMILLYREFTTT
jgi:uncharacterized membrane protein YozB (DUF420 family)